MIGKEIVNMFEDKKTKEKFFGDKIPGSTTQDPISAALFPEEPVCAMCCPNLTYTQRIVGFAICAGCGYLLSFIGTLTLIGGFSETNVATFAALYVCGNMIALFATGFLIGPKKQCVNMWKPTRRFTTAFYLIMLIVVLVVAVAKYDLDGKIYLILFLLFVQICAGIWYGLSYIPYGRDMVSGVIRRTYICFPCYFVYDECNDAIKKNKNQNSGIFSDV